MAKGGPLSKNSYAKNKTIRKNVYGGTRMGNPYAKDEKRETPKQDYRTRSGCWSKPLPQVMLGLA